MSGYQIGVTPANMVDLETLGLWDPLSDFSAYSARRPRMDGLLVGTGFPTAKWRFNELTIEQVGQLLYYVTTAGVQQGSKVVYIRTRVSQAWMTERVFQNYEAVMVNPFEPDEMEYAENRKYEDVEIVFTHCVAF